MWVSIVTVAVSVLIFALVDNKVGYTEKIALKIKKPALRIVLFILAVFIMGVLSAVIERVVLDISGSELLSDIAQSFVFGALIYFLVSGVTSKKDSKKDETTKD